MCKGKDSERKFKLYMPLSTLTANLYFTTQQIQIKCLFLCVVLIVERRKGASAARATADCWFYSLGGVIKLKSSRGWASFQQNIWTIKD